LIGYGSIGSTLANAIRDGKAGEARLVAVLDIHEQPPYDQMDGAPRYFTTLEEFLDVPLDVVVEAATQSVLRKFAPLILKSGRDVVAMSVGAFVDEAWLGEMEALARAHGCRIYLPPGAIGGLDALSAAMLDNVHTVSLTTIKPVKALRGSRSVVDPQLDLERITEATCLYDGPAEEAIRHFPKNVNVAAALSLSTIGFRETRVRIIADPHAKTNTHRIHAEGRFGSFSLELNLNASPANPKTSYLAALSAIRLLKGLTDTIRIGV
jgi:aspartate dehydrogenase